MGKIDGRRRPVGDDGGETAGGAVSGRDGRPRDAVWGPVEDCLAQATQLLERGYIGDDFVEDFASRCAVTPTIERSSKGTSFVCAPRDEVRIGGREFALEVDARGVVSLVSVSTLERAAAQRLCDDAMDRLAPSCEGGRPAFEREGDDEDVIMWLCSTSGGPYLGVGRTATDGDADLWHVTIAVLSPSGGR